MKVIDIKNLQIGDMLGGGFFGDVYACKYNQRHYAYKKIINDEPLKKILSEKNISKFDALNEMNLKKSITPSLLVKDHTLSGYLSRKVDKFDSSFVDDWEEKYNILIQIKEAMLELHSNNVIHTDIYSGNILRKGNDYFLCDFDNATIGNNIPDLNFCSASAYEFLDARGFSKDLDIYMFNNLTFQFLSDPKTILDDIEAETAIVTKKYGIFNGREQRKICDSLLLDNLNTSFNNDLLIDTINISKIKRKKRF